MLVNCEAGVGPVAGWGIDGGATDGSEQEEDCCLLDADAATSCKVTVEML